MNYLIFTLRLIHILSGVFWVGSAVFSGFFIFPAVDATGKAGEKFLEYMITQERVSTRLGIAGMLTVLAGGWLYWIDSAGFTSGWVSAGAGRGFGIGGILALIGFVTGGLGSRDRAMFIKLTKGIQDGKLIKGQMDQIQKLRTLSIRWGLISNFALILALACMATARYWQF
jgi:uncharacterized membrane protein